MVVGVGKFISTPKCTIAIAGVMGRRSIHLAVLGLAALQDGVSACPLRPACP